MKELEDEAFDKGYDAGVMWVLLGERAKCPYSEQSNAYSTFFNAFAQAVEEMQEEQFYPEDEDRR